MIRWLLRLYPRAWRERYGDEFLELVAAEGLGLRVFVDVLWSAMGERVRWAAPDILPGLRSVVGYYCAGHAMAWFLNWVIGDPIRSAAWWTVDGLMLSAAVQARAAMITCALGFGVLWMFSRRSHRTRSIVLDWLRLALAISVSLTESVLSSSGVQPTRETMVLAFGAGQFALALAPMIFVGEWIRLVGYRWLNPEPQSRPLNP